MYRTKQYDNLIVTHHVSSANTTPPPKASCVGESTPNILTDFMGIMPRHAFKNLFQLCTGSGVLAICFQMKRDSEPKSLLQLEPAEGVLNKCPRAACLMLLLAVNP